MNKNDTTPQTQKVLNDIYGQMVPVAKAERIFSAYRMGRELALAGLKLRYPKATKRQLWYLWARQHLGDDLFKNVYGIVQND